MSTWLEVVPAYGRDYKNQKSVQTDWDAGKDFQDPFTGQYINKQDAERDGIRPIIRYDRNLKTYAPK